MCCVHTYTHSIYVYTFNLICIYVYIQLNDLEWNGFRSFLMEMKWQRTLSIQFKHCSDFNIHFRKILYTCEKNKKNNEKQNSENSMPALLTDASRIVMCVTYLLE